jgi:hypothetical protein
MPEWNPNHRYRCHDCGVLEGEYHEPGCDMEPCPFCLQQLISCDCVYNLLKIDASPGTWAYSNGLTDEQAEEWEKMLEKKGKVRFVVLPNLCARCGQTWPDFFTVSDWHEIMPPDVQPNILCRNCYEVVKRFILQAQNENVLGHSDDK